MFLILNSCTSPQDKSVRSVTVTGAEEREKSIEEWEKNIFQNGDSGAYEKLYTYYRVKGDECIEGKIITKVMADRYSYGPACYNIFSCMIGNADINKFEISDLEPSDQKKAIDYLKKASKAEVMNAALVLKRLKLDVE